MPTPPLVFNFKPTNLVVQSRRRVGSNKGFTSNKQTQIFQSKFQAILDKNEGTDYHVLVFEILKGALLQAKNYFETSEFEWLCTTEEEGNYDLSERELYISESVFFKSNSEERKKEKKNLEEAFAKLNEKKIFLIEKKLRKILFKSK